MKVEKVFILFCVCFELCFRSIKSDLLKINNIIRTLQPPLVEYGNDRNNNQYLGQTTTEFFLPEIIVNRNALPSTIDGLGRSQYSPINLKNSFVQPVNDQSKKHLPSISNNFYIPPPSSDIPVYFPPNISHNIGSSYLPPPTDELPVIIENDNTYPPLVVEPSRNYLPVYAEGKALKSATKKIKSNALRLELNELRCLRNNNGYFKATITVQNHLDILPIIDTVDLQDRKCDLQILQSKIHIHITADMFNRCGIVECVAQHLCAKIRFPQIPGMRSLADSMLTLQCKVQDRIASKMHSLRLGISRESESRNTGSFAHGGSQQPFRTQIGLYRLTADGNDFTESLESGAVVLLGEELMLRAHVKSGDGWNQSRIQDVSLQRLGLSGQILDTATVIQSNGCVHPAMVSMCPAPPIFEAPLGHSLRFRVVMFEGMKSGDEMIMSVRIVGCIDQNDCFVDPNTCNRFPLNRLKRSLIDSNNALTDVSRISFRVEMPNLSKNHQIAVQPLAVTVIVGTICFICLIAVIVLFVVNKNQLKYLCSN